MDTFGELQKDKSTYSFSSEPIVYLPGDYICAFQKSMESLKQYVDIYPILINSAQEVAYSQFSTYFRSNEKLDINEKKKLVEEYFSNSGFGKISLRALQAKGGYVETQFDNHSLEWKRKYGDREAEGTGASLFVIGFLCGVTEAIFEIAHGTFDGKQSACITLGDKKSRFEIFRGRKKGLRGTPKLGSAHAIEDGSEVSATLKSWSEVNLKGDSETGVIEAFGQSVVRHYANYYCLVSLRILIDIEKKVGKKGVSLARKNMIEASSHGAVSMFANFIKSNKWGEQFTTNSDSKEDFVKVGLDTMDALGWGKWQADLISENGETTFRVKNSFESNAYEKMLGHVKEPVCYFLYGAATGMMNVVYNGKVDQYTEIDDEFMEATTKGEEKYIIRAAKTRALGDGDDIVTVGRS